MARKIRLYSQNNKFIRFETKSFSHVPIKLVIIFQRPKQVTKIVKNKKPLQHLFHLHVVKCTFVYQVALVILQCMLSQS